MGSSDGVLVGTPDGLISSKIKKERKFYNQHEINELMMSFKATTVISCTYLLEGRCEGVLDGLVLGVAVGVAVG